MWGQGSDLASLSALRRIIPTRVGTRYLWEQICSHIEDHPHACGDKSLIAFFRLSAEGSSPRVWGQGALKPKLTAFSRIIPTRVGTSEFLGHIKLIDRDHPHACGDKKDDQYLIVSAKGSSPRVWGQADRKKRVTSARRIIPTRVGTRIVLISLLVTTKDHPHACGDKLIDRFIKRNEKGSSPRVWGQGYIQMKML